MTEPTTRPPTCAHEVCDDPEWCAAPPAGCRYSPAEKANEPPITDLIFLKQQSERLSVEDQHALAEFIAPNLGMMLVNEPPHPDCPHERSQPECSEVSRLIDYWREMSPGSKKAIREEDFMLAESLDKLAPPSTDSEASK